MSEPAVTHTGKAAAPGTATGKAHVVSEVSLGQPVPRGAILVARIIRPHLAPVLARIAAVVVEEGSLLQHATTLAREFGIPAVVGLHGATTLFREGDVLEVNGDTGVVSVVRDRS